MLILPMDRLSISTRLRLPKLKARKAECIKNWLCIINLELVRNRSNKMSQTEQVDPKIEDKDKRSDPAFELIEVNTSTGEIHLVIQKGIIGAMANQLKNTSDRRKGSSILRKLGYVLSDCGDVQYGKNIEDTDLDPSLVTGQIEE